MLADAKLNAPDCPPKAGALAAAKLKVPVEAPNGALDCAKAGVLAAPKAGVLLLSKPPGLAPNDGVPKLNAILLT